MSEAWEHCKDCRFWSQPVSPKHCHSDDPQEMGDCKHPETPIAAATHSGDWCDRFARPKEPEQ